MTQTETDEAGARSAKVLIRPARRGDVASIAAIFASDDKGGHGDTSDPAALPVYLEAYDRVAASPSDRLFVAEAEGQVVGTLQITFIVTLLHRGRMRAVVEAVQVSPERRGLGIGARLMAHAIEEAREAGAGVIELTSNKVRVDAHRFYERLGFSRSHEGFKLALEPSADPST